MPVALVVEVWIGVELQEVENDCGGWWKGMSCWRWLI